MLLIYQMPVALIPVRRCELFVRRRVSLRLRGRLSPLLPVSLAADAFVLVRSSGRAGCPPMTCGLSVRLNAVADGRRANAELVRRTELVGTSGDARRELTDNSELVRTRSCDV